MFGSLLKQIFPRGRNAPDAGPAAALLDRGLACEQQGRLDEAEAAYRKAVEREPRHADALHLLGRVVAGQGRGAEGVVLLERAALLDPQPVVYFNLAHAYTGISRLFEARQAYERALALAPEFAAAWNNLAGVCKKLRDYEQAEQCYRRLAALDPGALDVRCELGSMLLRQRRLDEAIASYRAVLEANPASVDAHSNLVYALNFHPGYTAEAVYEEHKRWGERHAEPFTRAAVPAVTDRMMDRRLRVGYVSPNFCDHPVAYFFEPTLRHHDPQAFDVILYSDVQQRDAYTDRLESLGGSWKATAALGDAELADLVRRDRIDILVDLTGHINDNRLLMFARRPAPVQVTWNGYANTTGMRAMDYRITDVYADPPGMTDHLHTERLVRLPEIYMAFQPPEPSPPVASPPVSRAGYITFGSFNAPHKLTSQVVATWAAILRALPDAQLLLAVMPEGRMRRELEGAFGAHGVPAERLAFVKRLPKADFLELHARVDIALDPFPFHGTTTTCHSLWMGVPVVTLAGRSHVSRVGVSMLSNLGLQNLVATGETDYVDIAVALARDRERLARLRLGLRERMRNAPNTDGARVTRHLEAAYRRMWSDYCRSADV